MMETCELPEFIIVLPEPVRRTEEYRPGSAHHSFLVNEVVPWIDEEFRTRARPSGRAVHGVSLGGLMAVWIGLNESGTFGAAGGQGGSFWYGRSRIVREVRQSAAVSTRFFVLCGRSDGNLIYNRALAAAMRESELRCHYSEVAGRHSWACWSRTLPDALRYYFANGNE
jgi:enterochelin esterase-like enzyme